MHLFVKADLEGVVLVLVVALGAFTFLLSRFLPFLDCLPWLDSVVRPAIDVEF